MQDNQKSLNAAFSNPFQEAVENFNYDNLSPFQRWELESFGNITENVNCDEIDSDPFSRLTTAESAFIFSHENPEA